MVYREKSVHLKTPMFYSKHTMFHGASNKFTFPSSFNRDN